MTSAITWVLLVLTSSTLVSKKVAAAEQTAEQETSTVTSEDRATLDALSNIVAVLAHTKDFPTDALSENVAAEAEHAALETSEAYTGRVASYDAEQASSEAVQQAMQASGAMPVYGQYRAPAAVATPRPFLAQAQEDLAALQNIHAAPEHALDAAAQQSAQELKAIEQPQPINVDTTWVDHTAEDIAANRKKVHDVAERIKREFFGMKLPQPAASLMEVPAEGPGASLIQHSIAAGAAATAGDSAASVARASEVLKEDSKHLESDFEKSFEKGMAEGFASEKKKNAMAMQSSQAEKAAVTQEEQEEERVDAARNSVAADLERQSEQSLRAHT